jgi:uncharacterized protein (UPF0218 family)
MRVAYSLTPELRRKLKTPIGALIQGPFAQTAKIFKDMVERERPVLIVSVGDIVSRNLAEIHVIAHVSIVDNKAMRRNIQPIPLRMEKTLNIKNPQGTITEQAIQVIQEALKSKSRVKIVVDGEEDLLTLVAIFYSPENSFVVYGQPHEGIVVVKVTLEKKSEVAEILETMEGARKAK